MGDKLLKWSSILLIVSIVAILGSFSYEILFTELSPMRGLFTIVYFIIPFGSIGAISSIIVLYEVYVRKFKTNIPLTNLNKIVFVISIIFLIVILSALLDVFDFGA
ncbi:MAG: hypothetical protein AABW82_03690 [Nanoarchaeota archaeon]